ncbi:MAG: hypothetical protein Q8Q37_00715 [bacterium]|nr:hypothetical protein [bacterium]
MKALIDKAIKPITIGATYGYAPHAIPQRIPMAAACEQVGHILGWLKKLGEK